MTDDPQQPSQRPSQSQLSAAEARIFDKAVSGLVGADGRPLGTTQVQWRKVPGVVYGLAFLMLDTGMVGLCHLEPRDCDLARVQVGPDTDPVEFLRLRVPPPQQQFAAPWAGAPGTLVDIMRGRARWMLTNAGRHAAVAEGLNPDDLPDGWRPPDEVVQPILQLNAGLVDADRTVIDREVGHVAGSASSTSDAAAADVDAPEHAGLDVRSMLTSVVGELERTRAAVGALLDSGADWDCVDLLSAVEEAVWPNGGRSNYPSPMPPGSSGDGGG